MKISIITPSFNQGQFIADSVESVMKQNYKNFEHIIIDNCSTDETLSVLSNYPHLTILSEKDSGQSNALDKGFKLANGDILGWLNADDIYEENVFKSVVNNFKLKKCDALYANFYFVNKELKILKKHYSHIPIRWLSLFHCYIPSTTFFFKQEIYSNGINIKEQFHICMDKDFFANILTNGYRVIFVNEFWAKFRWHESNKSLESPEVRKIRYKEGLEIFNNYGINIGSSYFSRKIYRITLKFLLSFRFLLKQLRKYN